MITLLAKALSKARIWLSNVQDSYNQICFVKQPKKEEIVIGDNGHLRVVHHDGNEHYNKLTAMPGGPFPVIAVEEKMVVMRGDSSTVEEVSWDRTMHTPAPPTLDRIQRLTHLIIERR